MGLFRRSSLEIGNQRTRRFLFLTIVRHHLGYATQIWAPQTIELFKQVERVQRRATKYILNLPFHCEVTYEDRLQATNLLPVSFWHGYLDLISFLKMINGMVCVSEEIIPKRKLGNKRITRATSNPETIIFRTKKSNTITFQGSFVNRTARIWNILPEELRHQPLTLRKFKSALKLDYISENPWTWRSICLKRSTARSLSAPLSCCF